ncbi:MAG: transcriptional regulator [Rhodobiaceae bacterium]|nr:MAG: transcriptional regulator [Rhodobiaceae bacterium]
MREPTRKPTQSGTPSRGNPDTCPVAATVAVLGDRWSILILRDLLLGLRRFDELVKSLGIATNILTNRLTRLTNEGLIFRQAYQTSPTRHEYLPTKAGEDFRKVIISIGNWGVTWRPHLAGHTPMQYVNAATGNPVMTKLIDTGTDTEIAADDMVPAMTEWADDITKWRFETAEAHRERDQADET